MLDVLQELVEGLAQDLKRSVAVDDAGLRLLASSTHFEDVDRARLGSLVGRRVNGPAREYVLAAGVQSWHEPTRLPANPEVGLEKDRYCFPLRSKYELLGFMWLLDDGTLTEDDIALAAESARRIQDVLIRKTETEVNADVEIESIVLGLLATDRHGRDQAADDLRGLGLFHRAAFFSVLVIRTESRESGPSSQTIRDAVRRGITHANQGRLRESYAYSAGAEQSLLLIGHRTTPSPQQLSSLATTIHVEIERFAPDVAIITTVGVGEPVMRLADALRAFDQAAVAAEVARDLGQVAASWANHPLETTLRTWLQPMIHKEMVPQIIRTLMAEPAELIEVLGAYLDAGGSVASTAEALHLHRTTIYYRLNRLQEATGIDLNDGASLLLIHLWLKARHISSFEE